ncbi:MAG TPA: type II toxin-antitoxin system VapC family toxin [Arachnia sp.]|mgnify:CR=1 FL=1|nr:type II toxin-antitoxin system VapC family toxin [Arachnia sp.]HMT86239.1 type II toxin-antitoxin system VapC family toxin [Arachnia sp.]
MGGVTGSGHLLDTQALIWLLSEPDRLSAAAMKITRDPSNLLYVSAASAWEIATKHRLGKLPQADAIIGGYDRHLRRADIETIEISNEHALLSGQLDWAHRDPFDRMIVATAMIEGLPLISADHEFRNLNGITLIW